MIINDKASTAYGTAVSNTYGTLPDYISVATTTATDVWGLVSNESEKIDPPRITDVTVEYEDKYITYVDKENRDENGNYLVTRVTKKIPKKVIVKFDDGKEEYALCHNDDEFNLEAGITICLCKYMLRKASYDTGDNPTKTYNKIVRQGVKIYKDNVKKEIKKNKEEEAKKIREAAKQRRRKRKAAKKREREIEIIAEAIRRANLK